MEALTLQKFMERTGETNEELAVFYLDSAKDVLMTHLYFNHPPDDLPEQYTERQILIAIDMYNKAGAEGELAHSENGITRSYESSWVSKQLLADLPRSIGAWR